MKIFAHVETEDGHSETWSTHDGIYRWRVDIVGPKGRTVHGRYGRLEDANEIADWFGRGGDVVWAEVVPIE